MNGLLEHSLALAGFVGGIAFAWGVQRLRRRFPRRVATSKNDHPRQAQGGELNAGSSGLRQLRFIEHIEDGYIFYRHDTAGRFTYLSRSIQRVLGYDPEEYRANYDDMFTDSPVNDLAREKTRLALQGQRQPTYPLEVRAKNGEIRQLDVTEYPVFDTDGRVEAVEGIAHDVTERNRLQARLGELAVRDELTGLANRRHLLERLEEAVSLARRHDYALSYVLIDLDDLKAVNDRFGHAAGDKMIRAVADILQRELRQGDVVGRATSLAGRLGGDEFGVIMPYCPAQSARAAFERILKKLHATTIPVGNDCDAAVSASIGIAEHAPGMRTEALEEHADQAMYRAKRAGRGCVVVQS